MALVEIDVSVAGPPERLDQGRTIAPRAMEGEFSALADPMRLGGTKSWVVFIWIGKDSATTASATVVGQADVMCEASEETHAWAGARFRNLSEPAP